MMQDVKMEKQGSVWDPTVNVVLEGGVLASERDFESFMESLAPGETAYPAARPTDASLKPKMVCVGAKRTPQPMATQRPKRCRKTRKQEIDHLRAVAMELEKKLKELNEAHNQGRTGVDPFWKRVSNRLLEQRQKSAVENARLRDLVREQITTFKALQRSLEKTPALSVSDLSVCLIKCILDPNMFHDGLQQNDVFPEVQERAVVPRQNKELYRDLFHNLSALYSAGVDTMLPQISGRSPSLDGSKKVNIEIETDSTDGLRMCLQVVENKLVPFCFEDIRNKAWKILTGTNGHEDFELTVQNQGDEMFGWCKLDNAMGPMRMLGNIAVRQYVEANKLTIIWECEGDVHQGDSKTRIQPKGWFVCSCWLHPSSFALLLTLSCCRCVFEPAEEDPAHATIFRRCAILSPLIPDDIHSERSIGATTELVLENYKRTVVYIFDGMLASLDRS
ncbi:unnamed protein product [Phytophthora lilii]|uniref:Unnamed protein product n=1 Tax=Phytophthora lilii TaxID=2077276 RepID=A0A9W6WZD8_9STRA|nr:unnamed protein product [Phytophthora lilii]